MNRTHLSRPWLTWLLCSLAGIVLIALPDQDRRLFSISEGHGPGVMDVAGALVLSAGWVVLDLQIWRGRRRILSMGRTRLLVSGLAALGGAVVLVWSVERDAGVWWLLGVAMLAGVQLDVAAEAMTHRDKPPRRGRPLSPGGVGLPPLLEER